MGSPGETRQTINKTLKFAKSLNLDYVQFSKTTAKPLTSLWHDMVEESGYDYWREYILGNTEERALPRPWTDLSNDEIDELACELGDCEQTLEECKRETHEGWSEEAAAMFL